ncbi:hypothetical protein ACI8AV_18075 [Geodermatophilus sp. SYSU D00804]
MTDHVYVVQFPHPGRERLPQPLAVGESLPWNTGDHGRKFLLTPGSWRECPDGPDRHGEVTFWGEWEAQSEVVELLAGGPALPRALQRPFYRVEHGGWRQNTDPLVFGDRFSYTNCRQPTNAKLRALPAGSVVLFGSKLHGGFVLDTVFVVGQAAGYRPSDGPPEGVHGAAEELVTDGLAQDPAHADFRFTWYGGATPAQPVAGMFSFTPARPHQPGTPGFARPRLRLDPVIHPNLAMAARCTPMGLAQAQDIWQRVVEQVTAAGLVLATHLPTPQRLTPPVVPETSRAPGRC